MRNTTFTLSLLMLAGPRTALAGGAWLAAGCSTESASEAAGGPAPLQDNGSGADFAPKAADDAGRSSPIPPYRGNPLCHIEPDAPPYGCMPDDDGYHRRSSRTNFCALPPPDAGDGGEGADYPGPGCRLSRRNAAGGTTVITPECFPNAAPNGGDGATCSAGADCAPGFDCVAGDLGTKSCRHYCCAGTCKGNTSQNGTMTFCDVQSLVEVSQKAPVCMPVKRCKLLGTGECASTETCAVVTEAGDTGCVATGEKHVGESCDESHCAATLTCLGQPGSRKCFKLCRVAASECANALSCATNAAFRDADFGICQ